MRDQPETPEAIFAARPWRALPETALGPVAHVPTMLSGEEQRLYYWLTRHWAQGTGEIVDLGAFTGGSTARLALGHAQAGLGCGIHAFDRFTADAKAKRTWLYPAGVPRFRGHDILPLAQDYLAPFARHVTFHPGEIEDHLWSGQPVEILTVDAGKTASTLDAMHRMFLPHMVAGRGIVVQQDLARWNQPWIAAQMELLSDCFTPLVYCRKSCVAYLCTRTPDRAEVEAARIQGRSDDEILAILDRAGARLAPFRLKRAVRRMQTALRANPRERTAWQFTRPW